MGMDVFITDTTGKLIDIIGIRNDANTLARFTDEFAHLSDASYDTVDTAISNKTTGIIGQTFIDRALTSIHKLLKFETISFVDANGDVDTTSFYELAHSCNLPEKLARLAVVYGELLKSQTTQTAVGLISELQNLLSDDDDYLIDLDDAIMAKIQAVASVLAIMHDHNVTLEFSC